MVNRCPGTELSSIVPYWRHCSSDFEDFLGPDVIFLLTEHVVKTVAVLSQRMSFETAEIRRRRLAGLDLYARLI